MRVRFGEWLLDRGRRELLRGEAAVPLTPKAFALLELLVDRRPNAVSKGEIYERLWPKTFVSEVNLSRLVFELRAALRDDSRLPRWIRTARGFGYAFAGAASEEPTAGAAAAREGGWCRLLFQNREVVLAEGGNELGRSNSSAVWLDSTSVSRRHACITVTGNKATLEDLGSKNGTFLRDTRVRETVSVADGDVIRVGAVEMTFRIVAPDVSTESGGLPDAGRR